METPCRRSCQMTRKFLQEKNKKMAAPSIVVVTEKTRIVSAADGETRMDCAANPLTSNGAVTSTSRNPGRVYFPRQPVDSALLIELPPSRPSSRTSLSRLPAPKRKNRSQNTCLILCPSIIIILLSSMMIACISANLLPLYVHIPLPYKEYRDCVLAQPMLAYTSDGDEIVLQPPVDLGGISPSCYLSFVCLDEKNQFVSVLFEIARHPKETIPYLYVYTNSPFIGHGGWVSYLQPPRDPGRVMDGRVFALLFFSSCFLFYGLFHFVLVFFTGRTWKEMYCTEDL